jgi:cellulose synthase/poly-beta-1,6-N-acetylglucosamine synthase-like glycosyltransferase
LALDITDLFLSRCFPPRQHHAANARESICARVAVVYTCCDDVDMEGLQGLTHFQDVRVFVLDDSNTAEAQEVIDHSPHTVVRRATREAFKGGNLNHWLTVYGKAYDYCLVLDSDSIVSMDALRELVAYAEHPANADVAIVQACILPRNGNAFQMCVGAFAAMRWSVLRRVHDWLGWSISQGHNCLHRVSALLDIGGFDVTVSCEDTLTSLRLRDRGWRTIVVDTVTFDAEPRHVFAYRRRTVRWARQTLDAIRWRRGGSDIALGLLVTRHLFSYLVPALWPVILVATGQLFLRRNPLCCEAPAAAAMKWQPLIAVIPIIALLLLVLLRFCTWRRSGGTVRSFVAASILRGTVAMFSSVHIGWGLLLSTLRGRVGFVPTGTASRESLGFAALASGMPVVSVVRAGVILVVCLTIELPAALTATYVVLWSTLPPLALWWFHRDQRALDR